MSHHKLKADNKGGVDETARGREGSSETGAQKLPSFYYAEKGNFFRAQTSPSELEKRKKFLGRTTKQTFDSSTNDGGRQGVRWGAGCGASQLHFSHVFLDVHLSGDGILRGG